MSPEIGIILKHQYGFTGLALFLSSHTEEIFKLYVIKYVSYWDVILHDTLLHLFCSFSALSFIQQLLTVFLLWFFPCSSLNYSQSNDLAPQVQVLIQHLKSLPWQDISPLLAISSRKGEYKASHYLMGRIKKRSHLQRRLKIIAISA